MSKPSPLFPIALLILASCQSPAPPTEKTVTSYADSTKVSAPTEWAGFYADTLPCADCPGILTQLALHPDSIFILRERYLEHDSIPFGHVGKWSVAQGELVLALGGAAPEHWRSVVNGLERLAADGNPNEGKLSFTIHRVKNIGSSSMRLTGAYVFDGGSHSFKPCGSAYAFPVALDLTDKQGVGGVLEKTYRKKVKQIGDPLFIDAVIDTRVGPAMEGEGTEEYLHIDRVVRVLEVQQCP